MSKFDLRFIGLIVINIVKSHVGMAWEWDPFEVTTHLTWLKFFLLTSLFFLFSFIFVGIPLTFPNNITFVYIHFQINNFSPSLLTSFLACLFIPQSLFWYVYPLILLLFLCRSCISNAFAGFVSWAGGMLSEMPDLNISINAANGSDDDHELHGGGEATSDTEEQV